MNPIVDAREFVRSQVISPVLVRPDVAESLKHKARASGRFLDHFKRVGDLLVYLKRFQPEHNDPIYALFKSQGLPTFEDILPEFESRFGMWADDRTTADDFVIGEQYHSFDILIFVGAYDPRAGGMFVLDTGGKPEAVVIKATLSGGKYPNEWLEPNRRLKYYLKSRKAAKATADVPPVFGEHFKENAAILEQPDIPILTFVRDTDAGPFTYAGVFHYRNIVRQSDGAKWFELSRADYDVVGPVVSAEHLERELQEQVKRALKEGSAGRAERLAKAPKKPKTVTVQSSAFIRNADVIAETLERASGNCEGCGSPAPFKRKSNGTPYLEVHHRLPLARGGEDTVENAVALCPNCHRKTHFG